MTMACVPNIYIQGSSGKFNKVNPEPVNAYDICADKK
jgi:hypothetical protein